MKFELKQHFQIESARFLPHLPPSHPCSRMHGHSFKIVLTLVGDLDPKIGWVIDYNDIQAHMKPLLALIDHRVLNEVEGLENPTSELLAKWIFDKARASLPMLTRVSVAETPLTECSYPA
ncbi:6-pyruvoyl trahydropterin synthase family protein [Bdellovibrio svalbardensis]|uniref:6-carboxy-5,6,7,8-tetrahydropterin synthase n=1 Tax=Bdellovibrio svalbardensis TaxID=2972972 RepID=A0ABT6DMU4_9BACT|nr:6-carboxytetrahydropterin synthase [Bdellovibrio svalbardensis]MDG0818200.1 6-carboxytetrahydropterin synthase [Bdellovibrio svalbardensis]